MTAEMPESCTGLAETEVTISLDGEFDSAAAHRTECEVLRASPGCIVHLDFGHVRSIQDVALGVLVDVIRRVGPDHVSLHSLSHHHEAVLRYLDTAPHC